MLTAMEVNIISYVCVPLQCRRDEIQSQVKAYASWRHRWLFSILSLWYKTTL